MCPRTEAAAWSDRGRADRFAADDQEKNTETTSRPGVASLAPGERQRGPRAGDRADGLAVNRLDRQTLRLAAKQRRDERRAARETGTPASRLAPERVRQQMEATAHAARRGLLGVREGN